MFVHGVVGGKHLFCPSRFVGYVECTAEKHIAFPDKDGSVTTPQISRLLGEHAADKSAESNYLQLCSLLNIQPSKKGRTYWSIGSLASPSTEVLRSGEPGFPDETDEYIEGSTKRVYVNAYERNPKARAACIKLYGATCVICGFNFQAKYGPVGEGFIHIHHLKLISKQSGEHTVNPATDLRPVCPNCHAMLHVSDPPLTIEELAEIVSAQT
ncbi:MAG: HNH endonuclease [Betaproteobacteria bacterium]|nr:MAG: HNH endonuclease [Betaproteobacteria bacterium]